MKLHTAFVYTATIHVLLTCSVTGLQFFFKLAQVLLCQEGRNNLFHISYVLLHSSMSSSRIFTISPVEDLYIFFLVWDWKKHLHEMVPFLVVFPKLSPLFPAQKNFTFFFYF
eukprot:Lithocolla_globosa_v1_NODE_745_length_3347_cov_15.393378.p4 type:complete len:112 gc:universal NODE_745_length_3347_cov_15.393378:448-113(-)